MAACSDAPFAAPSSPDPKSAAPCRLSENPNVKSPLVATPARCAVLALATVMALAELLGREPRPVDPQYGRTKARLVAVIDEDRCIGCALCLPACPVDAIVGAPRLMHTVIAGHCTGCELCLPPCPVDCIALVAPADGATTAPAAAEAA